MLWNNDILATFVRSETVVQLKVHYIHTKYLRVIGAPKLLHIVALCRGPDSFGWGMIFLCNLRWSIRNFLGASFTCHACGRKHCTVQVNLASNKFTWRRQIERTPDTKREGMSSISPGSPTPGNATTLGIIERDPECESPLLARDCSAWRVVGACTSNDVPSWLLTCDDSCESKYNE